MSEVRSGSITQQEVQSSVDRSRVFCLSIFLLWIIVTWDLGYGCLGSLLCGF